MSIVQTLISVKEDPALLKAIAAETEGSVESELTANFLHEVSQEYRPKKVAATEDEKND